MRADIWCDGAARKHPNPGPAGAGFVVITEGKKPIARSVPLGRRDNHVAEYEAVIRALKAAADQGATRAYLRTDSQLVVGHFTGAKKCRAPRLRTLLDDVRVQVARFPEGVTMSWVGRKFNAVADKLAQLARDAN